MAIRYRNPVPGGTIGRTDQGVDISGAPGTPVYAITNETLVGILQNWYNGQPFYWFKEKGTNIYNYVAEQFQSSLKPGQSVKAGQQIGEIASSGTGLELGFATASGQTVSTATTGPYSGSGPTAAGSAYRSQVISQKGSSQQNSLAQAWVDAGGPVGLANTMAAIAMAESGGRMDAVDHDPNGTTDYGPWQINSVHGFDPQRLMSSLSYSAKAAVAVYKSQGLGAWSTYNSGAYQQYLPGGSTATAIGPGPNGGIVRPGGSSNGSGSDTSGVQSILASYQQNVEQPTQSTTDYVSLGSTLFGWIPGYSDISAAVSDVNSFLSFIAWIFSPITWLRAAEFLTGIGIMAFGLESVFKSVAPQQRSGFGGIANAAGSLPQDIKGSKLVQFAMKEPIK